LKSLKTTEVITWRGYRQLKTIGR